MKKEILSLIMCLLLFICLTGCGDENNEKGKQEVNSDLNTNVEETTTNEPENLTTNTGNNNLVYDDEILDIDDEPNQAPEPDVIVSKIDESAEGLVFAYYQKKDAQLTFGDVLTNYTTDFTTLRKGNKQRRAFLGFKLDANDRIQRAYACVIYKGVLYALEGTTDGSKNDSNKAIMNRMYEPGEIEDKGYRYSAMKGETHAETYEKGEAHTFYDGGANIDRYGKIYCD